MTATDPALAEPITLTAVDGYPLAATRYPARGVVRGHVVVAAATAVPRSFYRRFAECAAERGYTTLTFDYRGVGGSRPPSLRGFEASMLDWAELDLVAAIELAAAAARSAGPTGSAGPSGSAGSLGVPLHLVGHSFGGQALGLLPDAGAITSAYLFGTGTGWHGCMPRLERARVLAMWRVAGPVMTRWKGYLNWSVLGMGEDLPLGVYRQWRRWSVHPDWLFGDPGSARPAARFERVRTPIVAVSSVDDRWAPPASRDLLLAEYGNAPRRTVDVDPRAGGLAPIGHLGYFRPPARPLWEAAFAAFDGYAAAS